MGKRWTAEDDERLRKMFPHLMPAEVALRLNRTVDSVQGRASILKLTKAPKRNGMTLEAKPVDTSDLPRREIVFKPYVPAPIPSWFRERMETVAAIPSYKPKAMQL